jgi:hypothetical protein
MTKCMLGLAEVSKGGVRRGLATKRGHIIKLRCSRGMLRRFQIKGCMREASDAQAILHAQVRLHVKDHPRHPKPCLT